jgi:hypothetical protein
MPGRAGDGERGGAFGLAHGLVDRQPLDSWHGIDRHALVGTVDQEQRPDQIVGGQHVLAHQAARPFRLAVAAQPYPKVEPDIGPCRWLVFDRRQARVRCDRSAEFDGHGGSVPGGSCSDFCYGMPLGRTGNGGMRRR